MWMKHLFFLMIRRPPRSTQGVSSAASDVYKRQALDWPLIEVGQSFKALSQSIKEFRMWVADERIQHNDNMLLTTSVNNAVLIRDGEDNVKINKKMNRQKIDPIISIITAFTEARMHEFQENWTEKYESEEFGF
ncbi:hypothetical protein JMUB7528_28330 [Staphylococcus aureus]